MDIAASYGFKDPVTKWLNVGARSSEWCECWPVASPLATKHHRPSAHLWFWPRPEQAVWCKFRLSLCLQPLPSAVHTLSTSTPRPSLMTHRLVGPSANAVQKFRDWNPLGANFRKWSMESKESDFSPCPSDRHFWGYLHFSRDASRSEFLREAARKKKTTVFSKGPFSMNLWCMFFTEETKYTGKWITPNARRITHIVIFLVYGVFFEDLLCSRHPSWHKRYNNKQSKQKPCIQLAKDDMRCLEIELLAQALHSENVFSSI